MTNFDAETLHELRNFREVAIRTEKRPKSAVVIWVVVADGEVFVRSWRGTDGRWYRDLVAVGPATLNFAGCRLAVQAIPASAAAAVARATREYLRKYRPSRRAPMPGRWYAPRCCRPRRKSELHQSCAFHEPGEVPSGPDNGLILDSLSRMFTVVNQGR
jgi:hypothetical protein